LEIFFGGVYILNPLKHPLSFLETKKNIAGFDGLGFDGLNTQIKLKLREFEVRSREGRSGLGRKSLMKRASLPHFDASGPEPDPAQGDRMPPDAFIIHSMPSAQGMTVIPVVTLPVFS